MSRFHETLSRMQADWIMHDKSKAYLLPPLDAALANLWLYWHWNGEKPEITLVPIKRKGPSSVVDPDGWLQAFVDQSLEGIDTQEVWAKREICPGCGWRYKLENMVTCVDCHRSLCWRCDAYRGGKGICACGGEMY